MTHISAPAPKGKVNINKFRDECRNWINESPLPPAQKLVLCKLADYVNSETLVAWPSYDTGGRHGSEQENGHQRNQ